ncbi:hypothetical protein Tco_0569907 [Tanacetum coccineum]
MPLGDHATHWANYLEELVRELSLHYPYWRQMPSERKARVVAKIGTQFDLRITWNPIAGHKSMRASSSICKRSTMARRLLLKKGIGFLTRTGLTTWSAADADVPRTFLSSTTREYPSLIHTFFLTHTIGGVFLNPEDKALYDEMCWQWLPERCLGSNTSMGCHYTAEENHSIVTGTASRAIPVVGRVLLRAILPFGHSPRSYDTHSSIVAKLKKERETRLTDSDDTVESYAHGTVAHVVLVV